MTILVLSCDKNEKLFFPFKHCIEKNFPNHPEVIYATESIKNPYYKTITKDIPLEKWSKRIRNTLEEIYDDIILIMIDDVFIRTSVDTKRLKEAEMFLRKTPNAACVNLEKSFDEKDRYVAEGIKQRRHPSLYELSIMCGIWRKEALIDILEGEHDPWEIEWNQDTKGWNFYINGGDYIINWGYETWKPVGLVKGVWTEEAKEFLKKEGIKID